MCVSHLVQYLRCQYTTILTFLFVFSSPVTTKNKATNFYKARLWYHINAETSKVIFPLFGRSSIAFCSFKNNILVFLLFSPYCHQQKLVSKQSIFINQAYGIISNLRLVRQHSLYIGKPWLVFMSL